MKLRDRIALRLIAVVQEHIASEPGPVLCIRCGNPVTQRIMVPAEHGTWEPCNHIPDPRPT